MFLWNSTCGRKKNAFLRRNVNKCQTQKNLEIAKASEMIQMHEFQEVFTDFWTHHTREQPSPLDYREFVNKASDSIHYSATLATHGSMDVTYSWSPDDESLSFRRHYEVDVVGFE